MRDKFILIAGSTTKQMVGIRNGSFDAGYQAEINELHIRPTEMKCLGLNSGDFVKLTSEFGEVQVVIKSSSDYELPSGLLFIANGETSSQLMGSDTHGTGMPTIKGIDVSVEKM